MKIIRGTQPTGVLLAALLLFGSTVHAQEPSPGSSAAATPQATETPAASTQAPPSSFPRLVLIDARDVLGAPLSWRGPQWGKFSLAVAGVGAAALLDRTVRDAERR